MLQNFNQINNNLKVMGISVSILIGLFFYLLIKSDVFMQNSICYIGMVLLFILIILVFTLQKNQIKQFISTDALNANELQSEHNHIGNTNDTIEVIKSDISFDDVAGIDNIKEELEEIVDFLNNPKKYTKYDVFLPKGILLAGPPGVGKTLMARAVAGEANVPFFYQSGANFVNIYVGMGAKRVRELFDQAKAKAPSIIFIDEIDAIGKERGIGSNDEREATLNELLTQMDGFSGNSGVIVIAATNKVEVLDEALLRAGRFDRRVILALPAKNDRQKILALYLRSKLTDLNLDKLANDTSGFSSAALATLVNEALLNMIKRSGDSLVEEDIEIAKKKIQFGKKQVAILDNTQKNILATYQASKAYISRQKVMLLDEGLNSLDFMYPSKTQLENQIANYLAGSVGVEIFLKEPYAVFESELKEAKRLANLMVNNYHMASCSEIVIETIKAKLRDKIRANKDKVLQLKSKLLEDEVVVF